MKLLHRLSLLIIVTLVALPLVIMAQDNSQPQPPATLDIQPARTATLELLEYPTPTLDIRPAQTATLELIEYPTADTGTVTFPLDTCGNDDPNTLFIPVCPPTKTPTPRPTPQPTTAIVNGLWVLDPKGSTYTSNGQCQIEGGDNGGPDGNGDSIEDLPKVPVCMTSDNQWLTVDNGGTYPLVIANYYSQQEMSRELTYSGGKTNGSVNINTTRQYHVISPTEIEFSYIRHEEGGCTTNSSVRYKLVEANDLVCKGAMITPDYTAVPTQMPTAQPGETQQPPITPEPPIQIGDYTIQLPPVDATCKADQMPSSDQLNVSYDNNQNLFINFGSGSYTLYWNGSDYYSYSEGNRFDISVSTYPGGASFTWSKDGCFINSPLSGAGFPATATPEAVEPTLEPTMDVASIAGSTYSVKADAPVYLCAAENKSMLPDLSGATLTAQADNTMTFSVGGTDYALTSMSGVLAYVQTNADGSILTISMNGFSDGVGSGAFMVMAGDGSKSCIAQLTFTPKG